MARGDECKTATKANHACKYLDVVGPPKKPMSAPATSSSQAKKLEPKNYGAWGPIFKDKNTFADMHHC